MAVAGSHPSSHQERPSHDTHTHAHAVVSLSLTETRSRFKGSINATEEAWTWRSNKPPQHPNLQDFQMFYVCEFTTRNEESVLIWQTYLMFHLWLVEVFFNAPLHENWSLSAFSPPPVRYWAQHINHVLHFLLPMCTWAHLIGAGSSISGRNCRFWSGSPSILQPAAWKGCISLHSFCLCLMCLSFVACCPFLFLLCLCVCISVWRTSFMKVFRLLASILYHLIVVMSLDVLYNRWQNPGWH